MSLSWVNVQAANMSLKVHCVVSVEGKLFAFALNRAVVLQNMSTSNSSIIINRNNAILRLLEPHTSRGKENRFSFKPQI